MSQGEVPAQVDTTPSQVNTTTPPLDGGESPDDNQDLKDEVVRKDTHQRVLLENRLTKQRAVTAEAKLKALEEAQLQEQQKYKELSDRYKTELDAVKEAKTRLQLEGQLMPALTKAGCVDVTAAMQLGDNKMLFGGGEHNLEGVEEYIKDLQKTRPYMFDSGKPSSVNSALPSGGLNVERKPTPAVTESSTLDEIKAAARALDKRIAGT